MKYAIEMAQDGKIHVPSLLQIGCSVPNVLQGDTHTHRAK
jgi:hypothetical protein